LKLPSKAWDRPWRLELPAQLTAGESEATPERLGESQRSLLVEQSWAPLVSK